MKPVKRIGILTGGGDCPGLNAVIRAVTKSAIFRYGLEVSGIEDGCQGLMESRFRPLGVDSVSNILTQGGTILGTNNRIDPTNYKFMENGEIRHEDRTSLCIDNLNRAGIDAMIVIGGDGTMSVASHFASVGFPIIGVPKTIDNDLVGTDLTFGFQSAVSVATDALDRIHTTAASHHRAMVVEVMGRNAGWIALHAGIASGSDVILIPEIPYSMESICDFVTGRSKKGKRFSILCVSEGARNRDGIQVIHEVDPLRAEPVRLGGAGEQVATEIERITGIETRTTVLGHVQRGGTPVAQDRILGTSFGAYALDLLLSGERGKLVVKKGSHLESIDLALVANKQRVVPLDEPLLDAARGVGTSFGD